VALDVAHRYAQSAVRQGNEVEIVAAGLIGGISCCGKVETGNRRRGPIKLLLDLPRQTQLDFPFLAVESLSHVLYHGHEVGSVAAFVNDRGDGLLNGIDFPGFSSVVYGCLK
jgi:hypothetical protein